MADKLEGRRPPEMAGVNLDKEVGREAQTGKGAWRHAPTWILSIAVVMLTTLGLATRHEDAAVTPRRTAQVQAPSPERSYVSSRMENVVIAEFTPAERGGDDQYAAYVHLMGKDGMEMTLRPPLSCQDDPIAARVGRAVRIRSDFWRLRGDGEERLLSPDDAQAALCGDFAGRDVPRTGLKTSVDASDAGETR